jgi:hypothetical protein
VVGEKRSLGTKDTKDTTIKRAPGFPVPETRCTAPGVTTPKKERTHHETTRLSHPLKWTASPKIGIIDIPTNTSTDDNYDPDTGELSQQYSRTTIYQEKVNQRSTTL